MKLISACAAAALLAIALSTGPAANAQAPVLRNPTVDDLVSRLKPKVSWGPTRGFRPSTLPGAPQSNDSSSTSDSETPHADMFIPFASGSADIAPEAIPELRKIGKALTDPSLAHYRFRIEGHTDTVGNPAANKALSERRAATVVNYLTREFFIPPRRLEAVGVGSDHLAVPTGDQVAEARNRRVQIVNLGS